MRLAPWLLASVSLCLCGACNKTQPPPFKPVADVKELMNDILDPAADDVWGASGWIETKDGVVERGPKNNEEGAAVAGRDRISDSLARRPANRRHGCCRVIEKSSCSSRPSLGRFSPAHACR